jgi:hypothetical protein
MRTKVLTALVGIGAAVALAGCGSTASTAGTTTTSVPATSSTTPSVQNLAVTTAVRHQLLVAGAASHHLSPADYTGLAHGTTYYAYDPITRTYWAAARLVPSPSSNAAQVGAQDDGSYNVFVKAPSHAWVAYPDGLGGIAGTHCAIVVPLPVRLAWVWSLSTPCGAPPH